MDDVHHEPTERSPLIPKFPQSVESGSTPGLNSADEANNPAESQERSTNTSNIISSDAEAQNATKPADEDPSASPGDPALRKRLPYILPVVGIGVFLAAADQTIVVSSYGKIGSDLHALSSTSWIATAYFLTLTSFQPLYGKLADIFGRKSCLMFSYTVFGLGCLGCGLARSIEELIAARAFAGIGGGGMTTVVSILLSDIVTLRERGTWQGYLNIIFAAGVSVGAPLGGLLADSIGWRWAFLGQAPLSGIAIIGTSALLHHIKGPDQHWRGKLRRIDLLGALTLIGAVFTLLLALDRGSNVSWSSTVTLASLGASIPLFLIFILVEMKVAKEPFAPGHIIFERSLFASFMCCFFCASGVLAMLFFVPLYFQAVDGVSATEAGVRLIPYAVSSVSGSLFAGFYMHKTGRFYWLTVCCFVSLTLGMGLILLFSGLATQSLAGIILGICVAAFSGGIGITSTLIGLIANAKRQDQAVATACTYLFRSLGTVFGISMSATVANQALRSSLENRLTDGEAAREIADGVRESLEYLKGLDPATRAIVKDCYASSTRAAFGLQTALVVGALAAAWFIREKPLSK